MDLFSDSFFGGPALLNGLIPLSIGLKKFSIFAKECSKRYENTTKSNFEIEVLLSTPVLKLERIVSAEVSKNRN